MATVAKRKKKKADSFEMPIPAEIEYLGEEACVRYLLWCAFNQGPPKGQMQRDLAIMYARQRACGANNTDRAFMEGRSNGAQFAHFEEGGNAYARIHKRMTGREPSKGSVYSRQLARFPGDPKAWVDSVSDIKRVARETNKTVEELGIKSIEEPVKRKALSERGIQRHLNEYLRKDPGRKYTPKEVQKLREKIVHKHGYHAGK